MTPSRPAPSAVAKTAPTVTSESPACVVPIRPLTPQREFCARDHSRRVTARVRPWRGWGSGPRSRGIWAVAAGVASRVVAGRVSRAVRARAASGRPWPGPQAGDRQIQRTGQRRDAQQARRGHPVRVALRGDAGRGHGGRRTGTEAAEDRAHDHGGEGGGQRGGAVAGGGQQQAHAGDAAGAEAFHVGGEREAGRGRAQQQRAADGAGLGGGEGERGVQSAHGGGQEVRGEIPGREKGDEGPGRGGGAGGHGRSWTCEGAAR